MHVKTPLSVVSQDPELFNHICKLVEDKDEASLSDKKKLPTLSPIKKIFTTLGGYIATPLEWFAGTRNFEAVKCLLKQGASSSVLQKLYKQTGLHFSSRRLRGPRFKPRGYSTDLCYLGSRGFSGPTCCKRTEQERDTYNGGNYNLRIDEL